MPALLLKTQIASIEIDVPCLERAKCFQAKLAEMLAFIHQAHGANDFLIKALSKKEFIEDFAHFLDHELYIFIDKDLEEFRENRKGNITKQNTRDKLLHTYYEIRRKEANKNNYAEFLLEKYPALAALIDRLINQHQAAMDKALRRIAADQNILLETFTVNSKAYTLTKITSTNSDLHKNGQQVLILELTEQTIKQGKEEDRGENIASNLKVIYKPSSVLMDMLLLGNTVAITDKIKAALKLEGVISIAEIINNTAKNIENTVLVKLPTYTILPMAISDSVIEQYGYTEYLSHLPWPDQLEKKIRDAIEENRSTAEQNGKRPDSVSKLANKIIKMEFKTSEQRAIEQIKNNELLCDYVAKNEYEHQIFSKQCGMLAAIATIFGVTDMHYENMITHSLQPYLIDLEISFTQAKPELSATGLLQPGSGSMLKNTGENTALPFLDSIDGIENISASMPHKNRFYIVKNNKLVAVNPLKSHFDESYTALINMVSENETLFSEWFKYSVMKSLYVRLIPYQTSDLINSLKNYKASLFDKNSIFEANKLYIEEFLIKNAEKINRGNYLEIEPIIAIFASGNIKFNFDSLNIPVFYMNVSSKKLINSEGAIIQINYNEIIKQFDINLGEIEDLSDKLAWPESTDNYLNISPVDFIKKTILNI